MNLNKSVPVVCRIGLLPMYMSRFDRGLVALPGLFEEAMRLQVWLAVNEESQEVIEVQTLVELIQRTFSERGEWFE